MIFRIVGKRDPLLLPTAEPMFYYSNMKWCSCIIFQNAVGPLNWTQWSKLTISVGEGGRWGGCCQLFPLTQQGVNTLNIGPCDCYTCRLISSLPANDDGSTTISIFNISRGGEEAGRGHCPWLKDLCFIRKSAEKDLKIPKSKAKDEIAQFTKNLIRISPNLQMMK